jgi:Fe-S-cluster containining protein
MTPERNAACPCGSGKKYKKCCGGPASPARVDPVALNRSIAYLGETGARRLAFCRDYLALKQSVLGVIEQKLEQDTREMGRSISCSKGCAVCCRLYFITASLQECEAIVYYLYQHEEILQLFLKAYPVWKTGMAKIERTFNRICQLSSKTILGRETPEERELFLTESQKYAAARVACPFLQDEACSIHAARPYVCAGVVSVSPAPWCDPADPHHLEMEFVKSQIPVEKEDPYFVRPSSGLLFASMPSLVYDLLQEGYDALACIPGLETMAAAAINDPQVAAALRRAGRI